jgi:uncharacterized protein (TIGR02757 family)
VARSSKNAAGGAPSARGFAARNGESSQEPAKKKRGDRGGSIHLALESVRARCDVGQRRAADPVEFVHSYDDPADRELVALVASSLAFGNVKALRAKIEDALARLGPGVALVADDPALVASRLRGWKHRVYRDSDLVGLLVGARRVQRASGSLGQALADEIRRTGALRSALSAWVTTIRREGGLDGAGESRGSAHILADPSKGSAVKRLMLLLRWMSRPADGVDLGLWPVPPSMLLMPVDTHIHKLSRNLGFTKRRDVSWRTAEEITAAMRRFDPDDPVKYDFALCHMGMLQGCPSRKDAGRCEGCGIIAVCRHWAR